MNLLALSSLAAVVDLVLGTPLGGLLALLSILSLIGLCVFVIFAAMASLFRLVYHPRVCSGGIARSRWLGLFGPWTLYRHTRPARVIGLWMTDRKVHRPGMRRKHRSPR